MDSSPTRSQKQKKSKPSPRRDGREAAVQFLFGTDLQGELGGSPEAFETFWELRQARSFAKDFATEIVRGVLEHLPEIDKLIRDRLENFAFHRLTLVDRNILRVGTYEIVFNKEIPSPVALNEAIEIAKRFGTDDSPRFVNGILDKVLKGVDTDEHES